MFLNLKSFCDIFLALLLHVGPGYLQHAHKRDRLTDPHGTAFAKLLVACLYSVLLNVVAHSSSAGSNGKTKSDSLVDTNKYMKRAVEPKSEELPSAKMRRLLESQQVVIENIG